MLLIGISTLCIALIPFLLVFLRVCDRIAVLKGVFEHLLLLQILGPRQTPCRTFWHGKQMISRYTTTIANTLFQISNHPQPLEKNSMHRVPIIHTITFQVLVCVLLPQFGLDCARYFSALQSQWWQYCGLNDVQNKPIPYKSVAERLPHICNTIADNGRRGDVQSKNFQSFSSQTSNHCAHSPEMG